MRGEKTSSAASHLLVHYHISVTQKLDTRRLDPSYSYSEDGDRQRYAYAAGTLFVDLVDPRTKRLVWRGWAEGSLDGVIDDQDWLDARVDDAVVRILQQLPRAL